MDKFNDPIWYGRPNMSYLGRIYSGTSEFRDKIKKAIKSEKGLESFEQ